ncbi:MAG TPA: hypothetical protein VF275_03350 [Gammaproteobacteria bacterium]
MDAFFLAASILLLVATAGLGWAILRRNRQRRSIFSRHEKPLPLARVWDEWLSPDASDNERVRREALFTLVEPAHREAVREDLLRFEERALAEPEPLLAIRRELMDSIDRRMLNREILALPENLKRGLRAQSGDVIANDAEAEAYLAANELRLEMLREYAGRRYGDRAPQDWFEVYERAARLKQRTARNYIARSMSGELNEEHDARQQAISLVDSQLRAHLLNVAPGTRFEQLAEPASPE